MVRVRTKKFQGYVALWNLAPTSRLSVRMISPHLFARARALFLSLSSHPPHRTHAGMYTGMVACLTGTIKQEGLLALWKGFGPTWLRLGPWQFCFWITYEELRMQTTGEGF